MYCECEKTEPAYFEAIRRACSSTLIVVETRPGVGVPYTIAKEAVEFAKSQGFAWYSRRTKESFEKHDQVRAVFDRDNHPRFGEAVELCRKHGVHVGCSNPCFELWLILHERDCNKPNSSRKMQAELNAVDWFRTIAVLRFDGVQSQLVDQPILDHGRVRARVRIAVEGNTVIQCDLFPYSAQGSYHHSCRPGCAAREVMLTGPTGCISRSKHPAIGSSRSTEIHRA